MIQQFCSWVFIWKTENTNSKIQSPMFTAAPFTRCGSNPLVDDWIEKMQYIYTVEYSSAIKRKEILEFLLWLSGLLTLLVSMKMWDRSLVLLSGLKILCCCELWFRLQTQFGSHVSVAVVQASCYSSDLTPSLGTSICCTLGP